MSFFYIYIKNIIQNYRYYRVFLQVSYFLYFDFKKCKFIIYFNSPYFLLFKNMVDFFFLTSNNENKLTSFELDPSALNSWSTPIPKDIDFESKTPIPIPIPIPIPTHQPKQKQMQRQPKD